MAPSGRTPAEAAQRLGVTRSRIYALVRQGELDDGGDTLRITAASVERRLAASPPTGEPIGPLGAWAILALASHDAAFRGHLAGRLSDSDRSRAKGRLERRGLLELVPRLPARAVVGHFVAGGEALLALVEDPRGVLAGPSAARALGWPLPAGDWPVDLYSAEAAAALERASALLLRHNLSMDQVAVTSGEAPPVAEQRVRTGWAGSWRGSLLGILARHTLCSPLVSRLGRVDTVIVVGHQPTSREERARRGPSPPLA